MYRKPKLPVEMEFENTEDDDDSPLNTNWDPAEILEHAAKMGELKESIYNKAKKNIDAAQKRDKYYYDRKHSDERVCNPVYSLIK